MDMAIEAAADQAFPCSQAVIVLPDGAALVLRTVTPEDEPALERLFFRLSPRTLYQRFFAPIPVMAHQAYRMTALAHGDPTSSATFVAWDGAEIRGVARYDREAPPHCAELSILIEDAWQHRGLGKPLISQVILEARRQAITQCTVFILEDNIPALRLVKALFAYPQFSWNGDAWQVQLPLESFVPCDPDTGAPAS